MCKGHPRRGQRRDPGQGTPGPPQLPTCSSSLRLLGGSGEGGREKRTLGASDAAGRWVGAGGDRDGDRGIGEQILQPTGVSGTLPRRPPQRRPPAQRAPALLGGAGGEGRTRGSPLSTWEETLPNSVKQL